MTVTMFNPQLIGTNRIDDLILKSLYIVSDSLHWEIVPRYYSWRHRRDIAEYEESINPFEVKYIDPDAIEEVTRRKVPFFNERWTLPGTVKSGNWDRRPTFVFEPGYEKKEWLNTIFPTIQYNDSIFHRALVKRFNKRVDWFETEYIERVLDFIDRGQSVWHGCRTHEDVYERCQYVDELFYSIQSDGYKSQYELGNDFKSAVEQEIMVDIDRSGNPLFVDGRHRLSIAKCLDLDKIPVIVGVRHEESVADGAK